MARPGCSGGKRQRNVAIIAGVAPLLQVVRERRFDELEDGLLFSLHGCLHVLATTIMHTSAKMNPAAVRIF